MRKSAAYSYGYGLALAMDVSFLMPSTRGLSLLESAFGGTGHGFSPQGKAPGKILNQGGKWWVQKSGDSHKHGPYESEEHARKMAGRIGVAYDAETFSLWGRRSP